MRAEEALRWTQRQHHPEQSESPAANDIAWPMHAEHDAARSDQQGQKDCGRGSDQPPTSGRGKRQRECQVEDHRARGVPARERGSFYDDEMRLKIRPTTRDPIFLHFAETATDEDDKEQSE